MSGKNRKVRRDAVLKNIPSGDPRREQITAWLAEDGWESCAQRCLSELRIGTPFLRTQVSGKSQPSLRPVSRAMIYEAVKFWSQQDRFASNLEKAMNQARLEAEQKHMSAAQMEEAIDRYFVAQAAESEDAEGYKEMRLLRIRDQESKGNAKIAAAKLAQKERQLAQKDQEIAMMQMKCAGMLLSGALRAKADEINALNVSNAEKIALMRQAAFADVDALQASGEVVIPK